MMQVSLHPYDVFACGLFLFLGLIPWVIGFAWVLPDANRRGQPGWLWALLTLPFGWLALLVYLAFRTAGGAVPRA